MTTITPPPSTPPASAQPPAGPGSRGPASASPPPRHAGSVAIAVILIVIGALVLGGTVATAAIRTVGASAGAIDDTLTASTDGVTAVDVDISAATLEVLFDDGADGASLDLERTRPGWELERDGDELRVSGPSDGVFGFGQGWFGDDGRAVLTLPGDLEGVDASLSVGAGDITVDGTFGDVDIDMSAGDLTLTGEATGVVAGIGAGSADIRLADVRSVDFSVAAGDVRAELTGRAPREVSVEVDAGSVDLTLPDGAYDVRSDVDFGDVDDQLPTGTGTPIPVDVTVSAGDVTLRAAD